jgi:glycerophosphoryl diester phosphodiesterase
MKDRSRSTSVATRSRAPERPATPATDDNTHTQERPTSPSPICYAHRGARAYAPENTLLAFAVAFDLGADAVECDVQTSRDGRAVIIHDGLVDRTTNGTGAVAEMSFAELSQLDAGRLPRLPQRIPTLDETLDLVRECDGALNLEIKGENVDQCLATARVVAPILETLDDTWRARLLVSSFEHPALVELKERLPWLRIGVLFDKEWRGKDLVAVAKGLGAEAIHPAVQLLDPTLINRAHKADLRVNVWTVNALHEMRALVKAGVDGIFTDYPERVIVARSLKDTALGAPLAPREDA